MLTRTAWLVLNAAIGLACANSALADPTFHFTEQGDTIRAATHFTPGDGTFDDGCINNTLPVEISTCAFFTAEQPLGTSFVKYVYLHEAGTVANLGSDAVFIQVVYLQPGLGEIRVRFISDYNTQPGEGFIIPIDGSPVLEETGAPIDVTTLLLNQLPAGLIIPPGLEITIQSEVSEVPQPGMPALLGLGLFAVGASRKKWSLAPGRRK